VEFYQNFNGQNNQRQLAVEDRDKTEK